MMRRVIEAPRNQKHRCAVCGKRGLLWESVSKALDFGSVVMEPGAKEPVRCDACERNSRMGSPAPGQSAAASGGGE